MSRMGCELDRLLDLHKYEMWEALQQIAKGEGRFSLDRLTHCSNTIDDMKEVAQKVINVVEGK